MARAKKETTQPKVCKYKTAEAEERAIIRRVRKYKAELQKELEGMTIQEEIEYMKKRRIEREAADKMSITKFAKQ